MEYKDVFYFSLVIFAAILVLIGLRFREYQSYIKFLDQVTELHEKGWRIIDWGKYSAPMNVTAYLAGWSKKGSDKVWCTKDALEKQKEIERAERLELTPPNLNDKTYQTHGWKDKELNENLV